MGLRSRFRNKNKEPIDKEQEKHSHQKEWKVEVAGVPLTLSRKTKTDYLSRENSAQSQELPQHASSASSTSTSTKEAARTSAPTSIIKVAESTDVQIIKREVIGDKSESKKNGVWDVLRSFLGTDQTKGNGWNRYIWFPVLGLGLLLGPGLAIGVAMAVKQIAILAAITITGVYYFQTMRAIKVSEHRAQEHREKVEKEKQVQIHEITTTAQTRVMMHLVEHGQMEMLKGSAAGFLGGTPMIDGPRFARRRAIMDT